MTEVLGTGGGNTRFARTYGHPRPGPRQACKRTPSSALCSISSFRFGCWPAHEATGWWDIGYASTRREITHYEQHAHSFLEVVPLMAALLVIVLHWGQFLALFGAGPETARFSLEWKAQPLPLAFSVGTMAAAIVLEIVPYSEELWRCLKATHGRLVPQQAGTRKR